MTKIRGLFNVLILLIVLVIPTLTQNCEPEEIHISLYPQEKENAEDADRWNRMAITWRTPEPCENSVVEYERTASLGDETEPNFSNSVTATSKLLELPDKKPTTATIHQAVTNVLTIPREEYSYRLRSGDDVSKIYTFLTPLTTSDTEDVGTIILYGDMGVGAHAEETIEAIRLEHKKDVVDAIHHNGDFAYDLDDDEGERARVFFNQIQPISTQIPYMACPGNHEFYHQSLPQYLQRMNLPPSPRHNYFYSYQIKNMRVITITTQFYFPEWVPGMGDEERDVQDAWLREELVKASEDDTVSWITIIAHRPMYCSDVQEDCTIEPKIMRRRLEGLLLEFKVDFFIQAHKHVYERLYPISHGRACMTPGISLERYENPICPIYILTGTAGNEYYLPTEPYAPSKLTAKVGAGAAYARFDIYNSTHVHWEQVSSEDNQAFDEVWVVKDEQEAPERNPWIYWDIIPGTESLSMAELDEEKKDEGERNEETTTILGYVIGFFGVAVLLAILYAKNVKYRPTDPKEARLFKESDLSLPTPQRHHRF